MWMIYSAFLVYCAYFSFLLLLRLLFKTSLSFCELIFFYYQSYQCVYSQQLFPLVLVSNTRSMMLVGERESTILIEKEEKTKKKKKRRSSYFFCKKLSLYYFFVTYLLREDAMMECLVMCLGYNSIKAKTQECIV